MNILKELSRVKVFGGSLIKYSHASDTCKCTMKFNIFLPPNASSSAKAPLLWWLSGLTCTEDNFAQKAGAFRSAASLGLSIVMPDTSPRGDEVEALPGVKDSYDFGIGAGFYVDATAEKYSTHFRMYSYIVNELPALIASELDAIDSSRQSIFGHSMGGHGALVVALKNEGRYRSVSAFSPICAPAECQWGKKAFEHYLTGGVNEGKEAYDASVLAASYAGAAVAVLVDYGAADQFLADGQLQPEKLPTQSDRFRLTLRKQEGYDHSYYFISSFIDDHLQFHHKHLQM